MPGKGKNFNPNGVNTGPKPPCGKDCPDRKAGCLVNCQKWHDYVAERNANYEKRLAESRAATPPGKRTKEINRALYHHKNGGGK